MGGRMVDPQVNKLTDDLIREFEPAVLRDTIHQVVTDTVDSLADARIKSYVPILVRRIARDRLRILTRQSA
jgi:hypothetical protein